MAFDIDKFSPVGGHSPASWSYESATDPLHDAHSAGYFDEVGTHVDPGDFISVSMSDGKAIITVASTVLSPPTVVIDTVSIANAGGGAFVVQEVTITILNLVVADNHKFFVMNDSDPQVVGVPDNSSQPFPIGAEIDFIKEGGGVRFQPVSVAMIQSRGGLLKINAQYSAATLKKIDTDEWRLIGDLA